MNNIYFVHGMKDKTSSNTFPSLLFTTLNENK
jgi:hypothetical protein